MKYTAFNNLTYAMTEDDCYITYIMFHEDIPISTMHIKKEKKINEIVYYFINNSYEGWGIFRYFLWKYLTVYKKVLCKPSIQFSDIINRLWKYPSMLFIVFYEKNGKYIKLNINETVHYGKILIIHRYIPKLELFFINDEKYRKKHNRDFMSIWFGPNAYSEYKNP